MSPTAWISLAGFGFVVLTAIVTGVIWLVRLEGRVMEHSHAIRANAEALAAHAKAQALAIAGHQSDAVEARIEIVRVQEQIKHLTDMFFRMLLQRPNGEAPHP